MTCHGLICFSVVVCDLCVVQKERGGLHYRIVLKEIGKFNFCLNWKLFYFYILPVTLKFLGYWKKI